MKVHPVFYNSIKECMFCKKTTSEIYELPLSYFYGYKYCKDCNFMADKNMVEWIQQNKKISWLFLCKLINKKIALNHEDIEVAIGIIKKPISLKKIILIKIFRNTEAKEI